MGLTTLEYAALHGAGYAIGQPTTTDCMGLYCRRDNKPIDKVPNTEADKGKKTFSCSYCDKKFAQSNNMKYHERIHTGEKPYVCGYCEIKFSHPLSKSRHEKTWHSTHPINAN